MPEDTPDEELQVRPPTTVHTEIQWLLLKLGHNIRFGVWVARDDCSRGVPGHQFTELLRLKLELPLQVDDVSNRTLDDLSESYEIEEA